MFHMEIIDKQLKKNIYKYFRLDNDIMIIYYIFIYELELRLISWEYLHEFVSINIEK